jgi:hypothetical protein
MRLVQLLDRARVSAIATLARRAALVLALAGASAGGQGTRVPVDARLPAHPRILLLRGEEQRILHDVGTDPLRRKLHEAIIAGANEMLVLPPIERIQIGRRLLDKSREGLRRSFFLSYAWRTTRDERYLRRAERELVTIARFSDWNPSHFLDVAEMTTAMAIGYDWLYDGLSDSARAAIRAAILHKGLEPSLDSKYNSWLTVSNNWNQVCNAGMAYGAMAVYEDEPALARTIIDRAIGSVVLPMADYAPDGAYPEGYGYWGYGTSFNVMLLGALRGVFGTDFGLAARPGFLKTAGYLENMTGPTGAAFNYADSGPGGGLEPAMFWFAETLRDPGLLFVERARLAQVGAKRLAAERLLPAAMVFGKGIDLRAATAPKPLLWTGGGKNPVALMRTSWTDTSAIFVGIKGGSASDNHAHMDAGSFVLDADGVRWAMDFGAENYNQIEQAGVDLWNRSQGSQRWQVFRYNNLAHNTLTANGAMQDVAGRATITGTSSSPNFLAAVVDLSPAYATSLARATRGIALVDRNHVVVRDELETLAHPTTIRWNLVTPAAVRITGPRSAELTRDGRSLRLTVVGPAAVAMKTWPTTSPHAYEASNAGTTMVGFETTLPEHSAGTITVLLEPGPATNRARTPVPPLGEWPSARR